MFALVMIMRSKISFLSFFIVCQPFIMLFIVFVILCFGLLSCFLVVNRKMEIISSPVNIRIARLFSVFVFR